MIRYFKKSFVRYLAYGLAIALLSFLFGLFKVKAYTVEMKVGNINVTANNYIAITTSGVTKDIYINYTFDNVFSADSEMVVKYNLIGMTNNETYGTGNAKKVPYYFIMSYCSNVGASVVDIYNSNYNFIDLNYNTKTKCTANGYAGTLYNLYMRMVPSTYNMDGTDMQFSFSNQLRLQSRFTYNGYIGINAISIVSADEYEKNITNQNILAQQLILAENINSQTNAIVNAVDGLSSDIAGVQSSVDDLNSNINNDNVNGASSQASSFFNNFTTNTHGLTGIITAPLSAIASITSATCSPLVIPLPFVDEDLTLPCMRTVYEQFFGDFITLYDVIVTGIIAYWIMVRIFALVKDFKNPEHDEIEVMEL